MILTGCETEFKHGFLLTCRSYVMTEESDKKEAALDGQNTIGGVPNWEKNCDQ